MGNCIASPASNRRGLTVPEVAERHRVGEDKVRGCIRRGELKALNVADVRCGKPRFVVTAEALAEFERGRQAADPPKAPTRRKRRAAVVDYFPD